MIEQEAFLRLSDEDLSRLVAERGAQVCVLPINGVRRWFTMEFGTQLKGDWIKEYADKITPRLVVLYGMAFSQGLSTLISPVFGAELLKHESDELQKLGAEALERLSTHPDLLCFYEKYGVRVHFYGDYRRQLAETPYAYLSELFEGINKYTRKNKTHRLFYGVFANDATENIAALSVRHFIQTGKIPNRRTLIELYYGDFIESANLFIGFDKFSAFDYPLLNIGEESLYFTLAPSFYLTRTQLRQILYDHLYLRPASEPNYGQMSEQEITAMKEYYRSNRDKTYGLGQIQTGVWRPYLKQR